MLKLHSKASTVITCTYKEQNYILHMLEKFRSSIYISSTKSIMNVQLKFGVHMLIQPKLGNKKVRNQAIKTVM